MSPLRIPAVYMRGGTSKGVFFRADVLPADPIERDRLLLRIIGSPDPYGKQIDGMGGATSSTSKVVLVSKSNRSDCDVEYLFGAVSVKSPVIDWSGNCGNLTSAAGPFAISEGLVDAIDAGMQQVRLWQANIGKRIIAHVPVHGGQVVEDGDFELDGVTFPAAEIRLEFLDLGGDIDAECMFPTGNVIDKLSIPGLGIIDATLINAGNPTVFVEASSLGLLGNELQDAVNGNPELLILCETVRAHGAVAMGLCKSVAEATSHRPATPKLAFVSPPRDYVASNGKMVEKNGIDLNVRILSMGMLHHAMTGTGAIASAVAAAVPGTLVERTLGTPREEMRFGHPSGVLAVGASATLHNGEWQVVKAVMSRTARRLMEGWVRVSA